MIESPAVDLEHEARGSFFEKADPRDFSKLAIKDGMIHYRLYGQDGKFIPMNIQDTYGNRLFVSWVQGHDRYTKHASNQARESA